MSVFDAMATAVVQTIAVTYADDAVYTPIVGVPVDIRIVTGWRDEVSTFAGLEVQVRAPGVCGQVKYDQLAAPPEVGDSITILTGKFVGTYTIKDFFADVERSQWTLDFSN